jgi:tetratricopeptide (TPR) repeat protein
MIAAGLVAIVGFGVMFSWWWNSGITDAYEVLRIASQEFVGGRPIVAGELAATVEFEDESDVLDRRSERNLEYRGEARTVTARAAEEAKEARREQYEWIRLRDFLIGVGKVARGNEEDDLREQRRFLHEAIPYLESARNGGFPPGRHTQGNRILGESLFKLGRFDEAIVALRTAIDRDPTLQRVLLPLLAEAQLNAVAPLTKQSLATASKYLSDETLSPRQQWAGKLVQIRALIELKKWRETRDAVNRILYVPPTENERMASPAADFRNHVSLLRAAAIVTQAIDRNSYRSGNDPRGSIAASPELSDVVLDLEDLQREAAQKIASQAGLWSARAFLTQGMDEDALARLAPVRTQRPFGAEAMVAGLEEIELLAKSGRGDEMLVTTRYVMRELGDGKGFDPSLISFDTFERRLTDALDQLRQKGEYQQAIDVARSLAPVLDASEALTQEGIGFSEWAVATIAKGTNPGGEVSRTASTLARSRYRAAGEAFAQAATHLFNTEEYLTTQWAAIDAYQKGRHFGHSVRLLEPYLRYEEHRRQPRGLVAYGRALLAEDQPEKAIEILSACILEFPRDPLRYDARLLAALASAENGEFDTARTLLTLNLQDGELTPESPAWRDSLLTLGELLYERCYRNHLLAEKAAPQKRYELLRDNQPIIEEAVRYLEQAVERYWLIPRAESAAYFPRAESAAYLAARAHVLSSHWPRVQSTSPEILDAAKRTLRTQADQELQTALDGYRELRKHLSYREEEQRLTEREQSILRNCLFSEADVLREMNQLEDAAAAYQAVELRYINEPPALEAILGRVSCAKKLGRKKEADMLIRQANAVLQRIPDEWNGRFEDTTRYDRRGWEDLLTWMSERIENNGA